MKERKKKYTITYSTSSSNQQHKEEDVRKLLNKSLNLIINELIVNEHMKVGNC